MNFFLRKGDAAASKIVWLTFLPPLGLALIGLLNRRNIVAYSFIVPWAAIAALSLAVVGVWVITRDRNPEIKLNRYGPLRRFAALVSLFIFNGMIGYFAVLLGLPIIWSKVALTPQSDKVTATHILDERTGKGCHWQIEVDGGPLPESMIPCVSEALWGSLRTGDPVLITYTQSAFAFVIEDIQRAR